MANGPVLGLLEREPTTAITLAGAIVGMIGVYLGHGLGVDVARRELLGVLDDGPLWERLRTVEHDAREWLNGHGTPGGGS